MSGILYSNTETEVIYFEGIDVENRVEIERMGKKVLDVKTKTIPTSFGGGFLLIYKVAGGKS